MTTRNPTQNFVSATKLKAVIDTACTITGAGEAWFEN